jgi:hypothetical protein
MTPEAGGADNASMYPDGCPAKRLAAALTLVAGIVFGIDQALAGRSFVIAASPTAISVGNHSIGWAATYAAALATFGPSSSCTLGKEVDHRTPDPTTARAVWRKLGVVVDLKTYGGLSPGRTGCTTPGQIHVHTIRLTDSRWLTSRGVHVGVSVATVKERYPLARATREIPGWYRSGYWLVSRDVGGYEGIGGTRGSKAPVLVAETLNGRVSAFVLVVGGEGD